MALLGPVDLTTPLTKEELRKVRELYRRFRSGDSLSDTDLVIGVKYFKDLADIANYGGSVFHLAFCEANRVYMRMNDYLTERQRG